MVVTGQAAGAADMNPSSGRQNKSGAPHGAASAKRQLGKKQLRK